MTEFIEKAKPEQRENGFFEMAEIEHEFKKLIMFFK